MHAQTCAATGRRQAILRQIVLVPGRERTRMADSGAAKCAIFG